MRSFFVALVFTLCCVQSFAQSAADYTLQLTATVQTGPPSITLHWPPAVDATGFTVYRKAFGDAWWGTSIATLPGTDTAFTDTDVSNGMAFEYRVTKQTAAFSADGFIYAGIDKPASLWRGTLLLVVDDYFADSLSYELTRLAEDIRGSGWAVVRLDVQRTDSVPYVKNLIVDAYNANPSAVTAALLVGHVPVPYSGDIYPDGHPDHAGAWPADVFYADMNGIWSDYIVTDTVAYRPENRNEPGDGKYDQSLIPSDLELQVSRVDVFNMPAFGQSETVLLKRYLDKNHAYRQKQTSVQRRALVDDNFGGFSGEAFASCAWRSCAPIVGDTNIFELDFVSTLDTASYQWAYGCGAGNYEGANGIGSTWDFVDDSVNAVFTMLFGSYFGDWDSPNNFLRAPLCAPEPALTCCWAGRPWWFFHHMGLGENMGYSTRLSQNAGFSQYPGGYGQRFVHAALMGDLTLEQNVVAPPSSLLISQSAGSHAQLAWTASADSVIGYYVYRGTEPFGTYEPISGAVPTTAFTDSGTTAAGVYYYMVRAAKMEHTPSGTYVNLSEGIVDSVFLEVPLTVAAVPGQRIDIFPVPASSSLWFKAPTVDAARWEVLDLAGRRLMQGDVESLLQTVDISQLVSGMYLLRYTDTSRCLTTRFEIARQ